MLSPADDISPLTGIELIELNGGTLWCMGGRWPTGSVEYNLGYTKRARDASFYVLENYPETIVFLDAATGAEVITGQQLKDDFDLNDPLARAFYDWDTEGDVYNKGRYSWDPMTALLAIRGDNYEAGYDTVKGTGSIDIRTGETYWEESESGSHEYVETRFGSSYYSTEINDILSKEDWTSRTNTPVMLQKESSLKVTKNLVAEWNVENISSAKGEAVVSLEDTVGSLNFISGEFDSYPIYAGEVGGIPAIDFDGKSWMQTEEVLGLTGEVSAYAMIRWNALTTDYQSILAMDDGDPHLWHLKAKSSGLVVSSFDKSNRGADNLGANNISTDEWHIASMTMTSKGLSIYLDGELLDTYTGDYGVNEAQKLQLGTHRYNTNTEWERLDAWFNSARIYSVAHDAEQVKEVVFDMSYK